MTNYMIETIDSRKGYHKCKEIKNVKSLEIKPLIFIFHTEKGTKIRLRTDTWRNPIKL